MNDSTLCSEYDVHVNIFISYGKRFCLVSQCKTSSCSCSKGRISCSEFCGCKNEGCRNKWNMTYGDDDNDSDNYESDDSDDEYL